MEAIDFKNCDVKGNFFNLINTFRARPIRALFLKLSR